MPAQVATRDYQRAELALRSLVYAETGVLWRLLDTASLDATWWAFSAAMLRLVRTRRQASAALARSYVAAARAGVPGAPPTVRTPPLLEPAFLGELRLKSVISIKQAMTAGDDLPTAARNALVRTMGVADKYVEDGGRELIRAVVRIDPEASGWVRVTLGTCDYCAELAAEQTEQAGEADFPRHDHCGCVPEPEYFTRREGEEAQSWVESVTPPRSREQKSALRFWQTGRYNHLQAWLRDGQVEVPRFAAAVTEGPATVLIRTVEDAIANKSVDLAAAYRQAADGSLFNGELGENATLWRTFDSAGAGLTEADLAPGAIIADPGLMATGASRERVLALAEQGSAGGGIAGADVLLEIRAGRGTRFTSPEKHSGRDYATGVGEILLAPGTRLRIVSVGREQVVVATRMIRFGRWEPLEPPATREVLHVVAEVVR